MPALLLHSDSLNNRSVGDPGSPPQQANVGLVGDPGSQET